MQRHFVIIFGVVLVTLTGALAKKEPGVPAAMTTQKQLALVRVNVTGQSYDYFRPWQKKAPFSKRALGAVLSKGRVLVTADLVANQNFVELERAETGEKTAAKVQVIDYEANLALLEPTEKTFLDGITPLEITADTVVGDRLAAWQLEPTGALLATEGLVTTVQMTQYPIDVGEFLTYRISIPMQYRENSYTVPLVKNNKLAGLLLRYDSRSQLLDAIPAPIITHFLKEADSQNYRGFPSAGFSFFPNTRSGIARVCRRKRQGRRRLRYECGTKDAGNEGRAAGRRHRDSGRGTRDRPKWQLRGSAPREDRVHKFAYCARIFRRCCPVPRSAQRQTDAVKCDTRASGRERLCQPAVQFRPASALLCARWPHFSGTFPPVSQRMGSNLGRDQRPSVWFTLIVSNRNSFRREIAAS